MAGGLARASWGENPGGDYFLPLYYHDSSRLLTPLFGWDDRADFRYLVTPLAGVQTGGHAGSWIFPLYIHSRDKGTDEVRDNYCLLGGYWKEPRQSRSWFFPLFYYRNLLPPAPGLETNNFYSAGQKFLCLPFFWYENGTCLRPASRAVASANESDLPPPSSRNSPPAPDPAGTRAAPVCDYTLSHGTFPLWQYASRTTPAEGTARSDASILLRLYDYQHEAGPPRGDRAGVTNDYTRARVLWRLWHYERLNGSVSVDVFPSFTYDRKTDGYNKISFLWRGFRYESTPKGRSKLDILFIPVKR